MPAFLAPARPATVGAFLVLSGARMFCPTQLNRLRHTAVLVLVPESLFSQPARSLEETGRGTTARQKSATKNTDVSSCHYFIAGKF